MDYQKHYDALVLRAKHRVLAGYGENHHIIPKCLGGGNHKDNIARLTAEEHFVAHQLLVKLYPNVGSLAYAAVSMTRSNGYHQRTNNKLFGWLRRRSADCLRGKNLSAETRRKMSLAAQNRTPEQKAEISNKLKARRVTDETRAKISAASRNMSQETRDKISKASKGRKKSEATKAKMVIAHKLRGPEVFAKIGLAQKGRPKNPESIEKMRATKTGAKHTEETKRKMSESRKGKKKPPRTPEHIAKLTEAVRLAHQRKLSANQGGCPIGSVSGS